MEKTALSVDLANRKPPQAFGRKKMVSNETKKLNVELLDVFRGGTKAGGGDHFQVLLKAAKEES